MKPLQPGAKSVEDIRRIMGHLDREAVGGYFRSEPEEVDPFVVCEGVSVSAFNAYTEDDEGLPVRLRFLDLTDDGRLVINDWPDCIHECTRTTFGHVVLEACGRDVLGFRSAAEQKGKAHRAPDVAYGLGRDMPNRTPQSPRHSCLWDWITVSVSVGRTQTWESLARAAEWWLGYVGIQDVVLLKVNARGRYAQYRVFDALSQNERMGNRLPAPVQAEGAWYSETDEPASITFNTRRVLSIPADCALPDGVNESIRVDLRAVLGRVANSID